MDNWDRRERTAAGPGSNRTRAKARKAAKKYGNKVKRKEGKKSIGSD